jgi:sulfur-oxidizing protein SoxZ
MPSAPRHYPEPVLTFTPGVGEARVLLPASVEKDGVAYVRALITHPMDTGFFRDAEGRPIPPYFIHNVTVTYGDEPVAHFAWTSGLSRDPFVTFAIRATREAPVTVVWKDNRGAVYTQTAALKFATS